MGTTWTRSRSQPESNQLPPSDFQEEDKTLLQPTSTVTQFIERGIGTDDETIHQVHKIAELDDIIFHVTILKKCIVPRPSQVHSTKGPKVSQSAALKTCTYIQANGKMPHHSRPHNLYDRKSTLHARQCTHIVADHAPFFSIPLITCITKEKAPPSSL